MAKRQNESQDKIQDSSELTDKIELNMQALPLDQRVVSGRTVPIEDVRAKAKINVSPYSAEPDKYVVKIYRSNVMVSQGLVPKGAYSVEQVEGYFREQVVGGAYDTALTEVYLEQKAKRKS